MFLQKVNEMFKDPPNIFGIVDNILIVGYDVDGRHHDNLEKRNADMSLRKLQSKKKNKCHFRCTKVPFSGAGDIQRSVARPEEAAHANRNIPHHNKKELKLFYLS